MAEFTPTEDLVMEVLAARWRLGERIWTFDSRHRQAIFRLEDKGLVHAMHGIVEKTMRAGLTEQGQERWLMPGYVPPILRDSDED